MRSRRNEIFKLKMKFAGNHRSPDWTMSDLEEALKNLKTKQINTSKGCPNVELYLTMGHIPARFAIMKIRLAFLKYILNEDENSMISRNRTPRVSQI